MVQASVLQLPYEDESFDIVTCIAALEFGLAKFGHDVAFGRGVGAAQAILATGLPAGGAKS